MNFIDKNIDGDYVIICDEKYFTFNPHYITSNITNRYAETLKLCQG
jgi:hypothetical protein